MTIIQNQQSASPAFLLICGGILTVVSAMIAVGAAPLVGLVFWVASGLPLLVAGIVRMRVLASRGETVLNIDPQPLIFGEPFSGYIETGRALDMSKDTVVLQAVTYRYANVWWQSDDLKRAVTAAPDGRQRLEFAGTMPKQSELTQRQVLAIWRLQFRRAYFPPPVKRQ